MPTTAQATPATTSSAAPDLLQLLRLAERVARLNRDAGEIGPGMLASLVDDARRVLWLTPAKGNAPSVTLYRKVVAHNLQTAFSALNDAAACAQEAGLRPHLDLHLAQATQSVIRARGLLA